jgi:serine/threonine-protein kinase PpkA
MIVIAGACFVIGSPATESGRESDENQQRMCVAPFALGQCEVTLEDYAAFRAATGRAVTASSEHACLALAPSTGQWTWQREGDSGSGEEARAAPVRCISWHHAQGYAG